MKGFSVFFVKELQEIAHTWRGKVLLGVVLLFALTSAPLALLTPALLESFVPAGSGMTITLPDPTYLDAYMQWIKNVEQIVMMTLIIASGGLIAGELAANTAAMVLSKPLSRSAFVLSKFCGQALLVVASTALGAIVCEIATVLSFGGSDPVLMASVTGVWLVFALMMVALMTLLSSVFSPLAAGGIGVAAFFVISLGALWEPLVTYSPAGISTVTGALLAGKSPDIFWPIATSLLLGVVFLIAALLVFRRKEV